MPTWLAAIFLAFGVAGLAIGWRRRRDRAATIDRLGRRYGVERWPDESDENYVERIRDRIVESGGRKW